MSLILSWQNPLGLFDGVSSMRAKVYRDAVCIEEDAVWGFHEVLDGLPDTGEYSIQYVDAHGSQQHLVPWEEVVTWERPALGCTIAGYLRRPDGSADRGRILTVTDRKSNGMQFNRRYATNSVGRIAFLLMPGAQVMIHVDGDMKTIDFCTPDKRELDFSDLATHGTLIDADRRGWY